MLIIDSVNGMWQAIMMMRWRYGIIAAAGATLIVAVALHARIPQDPAYHHFADQRLVFGIPHFFDVFSNGALMIVGIAGLLALQRRRPGALPRLVSAYATFFAGSILIAFGSAIYHLNPGDRTLAYDRLPMTISFMAFVAIIIGEHIDVDLGRRALPMLLLIGALSVVYWQMRGDLKPYVLVQFLPMALIPIVLLLFPSVFSTVTHFWVMLTLYAAAKVFEVSDHRIYALSGVVSGHTLKHLTAAAAAAMLVVAIRRRQLVRSASAVLISAGA
jgi:hypothetical protein